MDTSEGRTLPTKGVGRRASSDARIADEPAFILHTYPYRETSLIVECLTLNHGRVALVARGAKRPRSAIRGLIRGFTPLTLNWTRSKGRTDLGMLTKAEWMGGMLPLQGQALVCGFYLNELLMKLLARDDPHPGAFRAYVEALTELGLSQEFGPPLRRFEYRLLKDMGYGAALTVAGESGKGIVPDQWYRFDPENGPVRARRDVADASGILGKTLLDLDSGELSDPISAAQAKQLMRFLLHHFLNGQTINSRQILRDLNDL